MLLAAGGAQAADPPPFRPHEATYAVSRGNSPVGQLQVELSRRDDGLWHFRIESQATAWFARVLGISTTEAAWFQWHQGQVLPLTYHHVSREPGSDRFWQHRYDWQQMRTETRTHDGDLRLRLETGILDPLTLRLAVAARLAEQAPDFDSFELSVIERDEIERQQYRFLGTETLEVEGSCYRTAVFKRFRKKGSGRNYTAWHAEALGWMPVRIAHDDDDDGKPVILTIEEWNSPGSSLQTSCEAATTMQ